MPLARAVSLATLQVPVTNRDRLLPLVTSSPRRDAADVLDNSLDAAVEVSDSAGLLGLTPISSDSRRKHGSFERLPPPAASVGTVGPSAARLKRLEGFRNPPSPLSPHALHSPPSTLSPSPDRRHRRSSLTKSSSLAALHVPVHHGSKPQLSSPLKIVVASLSPGKKGDGTASPLKTNPYSPRSPTRSPISKKGTISPIKPPIGCSPTKKSSPIKSGDPASPPKMAFGSPIKDPATHEHARRQDEGNEPFELEAPAEDEHGYARAPATLDETCSPSPERIRSLRERTRVQEGCRKRTGWGNDHGWGRAGEVSWWDLAACAIAERAEHADLAMVAATAAVKEVSGLAKMLEHDRLLARARNHAKTECAQIKKWKDDAFATFLGEPRGDGCGTDAPPGSPGKRSEPRPLSPGHFSRRYGKPPSPAKKLPQLRSPAMRLDGGFKSTAGVSNAESDARLREIENRAARARVFHTRGHSSS